MRLSSLIMLSGLALINLANQPKLETTATPSESSHESIYELAQVNENQIPETESSPTPHRGSGRKG
ncbi:heterocyst-inhibiting protein PatX [Limnospira indica]|uniref:heterocyst-inhibiting protein PatX n=1 Tax=Limnospira TaxID=2596745 RepID=UPI0001E2A80B|nr:hypothetical protein B9S53_02695 [Arthrospira sp. O9.13F]